MKMRELGASGRQRVAMYRALLDRVPDDIILRVRAHGNAGELKLDEAWHCICGWAVRERVADILHASVDAVFVPDKRWDQASRKRWDADTLAVEAAGYAVDWDAQMAIQIPAVAAAIYGGTTVEWKALYIDAAKPHLTPFVVLAYEQRVAAARRRALRARRKEHRKAADAFLAEIAASTPAIGAVPCAVPSHPLTR